VIGLGLTDTMARLWPEAEDTRIGQVADRYRFHYHGDGADGIPSTLFPGARELVDRLLQRDYLLAVATDKSRRGFDSVLGDTGLVDRFHTTHGLAPFGAHLAPEHIFRVPHDGDQEPVPGTDRGDPARAHAGSSGADVFPLGRWRVVRAISPMPASEPIRLDASKGNIMTF